MSKAALRAGHGRQGAGSPQRSHSGPASHGSRLRQDGQRISSAAPSTTRQATHTGGTTMARNSASARLAAQLRNEGME